MQSEISQQESNAANGAQDGQQGEDESDADASDEADSASAKDGANDDAAESASSATTSQKNGVPSVLAGKWDKQSDGLYYTCDETPKFDEKDKKAKSFEKYSELDWLGRCGAAVACVGLDIMPTGGRGSISEVKPTGWHTYKYDHVNGGYLYNRCHLLAYSLTGENANERNLITGTRQMNEAMIMFENIVYTYVTGSGKHCLYRVAPVFLEDELVARGVHMEGLSVEDGGRQVNFNVYIPNKQSRVKIDYATGKSSLVKGASASASGPGSGSGSNSNKSGTEKSAKSGAGTGATISKSVKTTYVLNTSTKKFHVTTCRHISSMKAKNKSVMKTTRKALILKGYSPCGSCSP